MVHIPAFVSRLLKLEYTHTHRHTQRIEFNWIKAHAGHQGNELADQIAKEAATNGDIEECYRRIPKSAVINELSDRSVTKWQSEWDHTTKGAITKSFFPKIAERLKMKINVNSKFHNKGNRTR